MGPTSRWVQGDGLSPVRHLGPSHGGRVRLERFAAAPERTLPRISVMPRVTSRPEADEPCLPPRRAWLGDPSIAPPGPLAVAVVDPGHAEGREQQLTQVLAAPPRGPERMTA